MVPRRLRRPLLLVGLLLASFSILAAAAVATGRAAFVGTHGVSMNPIYHQGDLVVVVKANTYRLGQIVAYRLPAAHVVVLHRIVGGNADGFVMKGDNNQSIDPTHPAAAQVVGRAVVHVPHGGRWLSRLTSPAVVALIAFTLTAGGGAAIQTRRRTRRAAMSRHATRGTGWTSPMSALPPALRPAGAALGVIGVLGLALGALAWTSPPDIQVPAASSPATQRLDFSYTAAVGSSPAYDATTARSPDPVFRRLTNSVVMRLDYQGSPGSMGVTAELSTPGGWHSSVPLTDPTSFTGTRYQSTVRLNLSAFDARARAAAAVTGLPASPINIAVMPSVHTAGAAVFMPVLRLNLTPLQLNLAGDEKSLTVQNASTAAPTARIQRRLNVLGRDITVARSRALSGLVLLAVVLAVAALAVVARRRFPVNEASAIRRRYAPLLAAVQPITTPPNSPVIEVNAFATLATLAERCGQLVLHWSRSGMDTFLVLDEGTTYRYRTGAADGVAVTTTASSASNTPGQDHEYGSAQTAVESPR